MTIILDFKFQDMKIDQCHSLWPVSELSHLRPRVKRDRSPEKTGRSWALPAAGRDPAARGMCPLMIVDKQNIRIKSNIYFLSHTQYNEELNSYASSRNNYQIKKRKNSFVKTVTPVFISFFSSCPIQRISIKLVFGCFYKISQNIFIFINHVYISYKSSFLSCKLKKIDCLFHFKNIFDLLLKMNF